MCCKCVQTIPLQDCSIIFLQPKAPTVPNLLQYTPSLSAPPPWLHSIPCCTPHWLHLLPGYTPALAAPLTCYILSLAAPLTNYTPSLLHPSLATPHPLLHPSLATACPFLHHPALHRKLLSLMDQINRYDLDLICFSSQTQPPL